jgi:hypothetical protein
MALFLDKRFVVNGKTAKIDLSNSFNLNKFIQTVSQTSIDSVAAEITDDVNTLRNTSIVTSTYTALPSDYRILVSQIGEAPTITLPSAIGITGKTYFIQAITYLNDVTISVDGIELFNAGTSVILTAQFQYVEVLAANGQWYIVNQG